MRWIFWGFCRNWFRMSPLHSFWAVPIFASNSRRYSSSKNDSPLSPIRGVADSAYQWYGLHNWYAESPTPRNFADSPHHRYGESAIEFFKRKLSVSMIRRVVLSTPRISYPVSRRLPISLSQGSRRLRVSLIRRVADSPYRWVGESTTPVIRESLLKKN